MSSEPKLLGVVLYVNEPETLVSFYCDVLGMARLTFEGDIAVGYGGLGAALIFRKSSSEAAYQHVQTDRYWKIAITLPDIDEAHRQLTAQGISATKPHQFRDIAYMSHLTDPEGYVIELIQHSFEGKPRTSNGSSNLPLGGGGQLGLITLRTTDIEAELMICRETFGMTYVSRQSVEDRGFDLYFLALTRERPPNADVNAVENREWIWQRPYTVLEFQHKLSGLDIRPADLEPAEVIIADGVGGHIRFI